MKNLSSIFYIILFISLSATAQNNIQFTADKTEGCAPLTVTFTNSSGAPQNTIYEWDFGDGNSYTGKDAVHTFTQAGYYYVSLTATKPNGDFLGSAFEEIMVKGINPWDMYLSAENVCPGETVYLSYWNWDEAPVSWYIDNVFVSNENYFEYVFTDIGEYKVKLITTSECGLDSIVKTVSVSNDIDPEVFIEASTSYTCPGNNIYFYFYSYGALTNVIWDFGDGTTSNLIYPEHSYNQNGNYTVTFTGTNLCGNSVTHEIIITISNDIESEVLIYASEYETCLGSNIEFYAYSWDELIDIQWNFGDGNTSTSLNPTHSYNNYGTYAVTLTAKNLCGNTVYAQETIVISNNYVFPELELYVYPDVACPKDPIYFDLWGGWVEFDSYLWNFGDGNTSTLEYPIHNYNTFGVYDVSVTVSKCGKSKTSTTQVTITNSLPIDPSEVEVGAVVELACKGDSILFYAFGASTYEFNFGDGSPVSSNTFEWDGITLIKHAYSTTGTYTITVKATNGCGSSTTKTIQFTVGSNAPVEGFIYWSNYGNTKACELIEFISSGGGTYEYNFGDGTTATTTNSIYPYTYNQPGDYEISVKVTNGCGNSETYYEDITILPPSTGFSIINTDSLKSCKEINFSAFGGSSYTWNFGDGTISTTTSGTHSHTYTKDSTYTITVTIEGCGTFSHSKQIMVYPGCSEGGGGVGVKEFGLNNFLKIYPNPANGLVNIESNTTEKITVKVLNNLGQTLLTKEDETGKFILNISSLKPGIYFLSLKEREKEVFKKLIVN
jgi:PKD repeat protein